MQLYHIKSNGNTTERIDYMRTAIMGAGSLGTILGAYIAKAGVQVDLIDTYKDHVEALNQKGAQITGTVEFTQPVKAYTPDMIEGKYDLVLFLVKQTNNAGAIEALKSHIHDKTIICTLQNGLPEPALVDAFGEERVMGAPVGWGATFKAPGVSELTSAPDKLTFDLGRVDGKITPEMEEVKAILECMCPTIVLDNLMGVRWTKILVNSTFSGMSACLGCTYGDVLDDPQAMLCVKHIANECINVAKKAGINMEPLQGYDLGKLVGFSTKEQREANTPVYVKMFTPHRALRASMLQDLEKGRKCEIGAINGAVCDMAERYGVEVPVNSQVVSIVKGIEEGRYKPEFKNLEMFVIPEI